MSSDVGLNVFDFAEVVVETVAETLDVVDCVVTSEDVIDEPVVGNKPGKNSALTVGL